MKKQRKKRLIALAMSAMMILSLTQNVAYNPYANDTNFGQVVEDVASTTDALSEEATTTVESTEMEPVMEIQDVDVYGETEPEALPFMDIVYGFEITPGDTSSNPLTMGQSFNINMLFKLPEDSQVPLDLNYIYYFDLTKVAVEEDMTDKEIIGLIKAANTDTPLDIVMGNVVVGKYTIVDGLVTLNFYEGIDTLMQDQNASRLGEFKFNCSLDQSKMNDEGGEYTLRFSTDTNIVNPTVKYKEKTTIDVDVDIEKTAGTFDADNNTMQYTITLKNTGNAPVSDIVVYDYMGNNLALKDGTVSIDNGASVTTDNVDSWSNDVKFTIPSLPVGTTTLTYTCDVSAAAITGANNASGSSNGLDNTITAKVTEADGDIKDIYINDNSTSQSTSFSIYKDLASKSVSVSDDKSTVTWTVVINRGSTEIDLKDYVFSDTMDSDLTLIPNSVSVTCSNSSDPAANITGLKNVITSGGTYTFPEGSTGEYTITYSATIPEHVGVEKYTNTATMTKDGVTDTAPATTPEIGSSISEKQYIGTGDDASDENSLPTTTDANGNLILRWQSKVAVPSDATKFVYTDYVQAVEWENGLGFEEDSFVISATDGNGGTINLSSPNDYTVSYTSNKADTSDITYDPNNMWDRTTYYMTVTFTSDGLDKINADGKTVITMEYNTIGRFTDRYKNDYQAYKNHYSVDVGTLNEDGTAQVYKVYKTPGTEGDVEKLLRVMMKKIIL